MTTVGAVLCSCVIRSHDAELCKAVRDWQRKMDAALLLAA
jgi:hypothetical protein